MYLPKNYSEFSLMAIDPGLHNIGVAVFHVKLIADNAAVIQSIDAETLSSNTIKKVSQHDTDIHEEQFLIRQNMARAVLGILEETKPTYFVTETAFFNPTRPNSFAILHAIITTLLDGVLLFDSNIVLGKLPPKNVKKAFNIASAIGKDPVKEAVGGTKVITNALKQSIDNMTEHAIDATAVGYAYLTDVLGLTLKENTDEV